MILIKSATLSENHAGLVEDFVQPQWESNQGRRKIDNWGGGNIHTRIYEYCPSPQLSIFRRP